MAATANREKIVLEHLLAIRSRNFVKQYTTVRKESFAYESVDSVNNIINVNTKC